MTGVQATAVLPGGRIGILGGGQLGRMSAMAAKHMGYHVVVADPDPAGPAGQVADEVLAAPLDDPALPRRLSETVDVVTLEWENVPVSLVQALEARLPMRPGHRVLQLTQDRLQEKEALRALGIATAPFASVRNRRELSRAIDALGLPCLLKTRTDGYDGKGQVRIGAADEVDAAFHALGGGNRPLIAEAYVAFQRELSVVAARTPSGATAAFPASENEHIDGILHRSTAPAPVPAGVLAKAREIALRVVEGLEVVGVMGVELFQTAEDVLLVNELAPRPHNSGHYTLDACPTSQFEQHVRAVCGLPLGGVHPPTPAVMLNILGQHLDRLLQQLPKLLSEPWLKVHLYGKREARPGRKMGHLTVLASSVGEAQEKAAWAWRHLEP